MSGSSTLRRVTRRTDSALGALQNQRVSIWDVQHGWRERFWVTFILQVFAAAAFEGWFAVHHGLAINDWHAVRDIISNTTPYIVLIGPCSYLITEASVMLSERYLAWRRRKGQEDLADWLDRRKEAWDRGEDFTELVPSTADEVTINANLEEIHARPGTRTEDSNGHRDLTEKLAALEAREKRVLEVEAWYGRKRLAEDRGESFGEPYPNGNGTPSQ